MGTHPIFESDFDCLTEIEIEMRTTLARSSYRINLPIFLGQKFFPAISGRATDKYDGWVEASWHNAKVGDPSRYDAQVERYKLDGWHHVTGQQGPTIESHLRVPAAVDPVNWRPLSDQERDLFDKRIDKMAKDRRRYYSMQYNPSTEAYWSETWSDKQFAQHEWAGSTWYRQSQGLKQIETYLWVTIFLTIYCWLETEKANFGPGKLWAPATDLANYRIEVIDMERNNFRPIGHYEGGEFKPY